MQNICAIKPNKSPASRRLLVLFILLLTVSACVDSKVYDWQDKTSNEHYSDSYNVDENVIDNKPSYGFYKIKKIYDGDTVELENGKKIRFLGLNTPELKHRDNDAEAGGEEAKAWLQGKLEHAKVRLEFDVERTDKYGRTLAYLVTDKNENINVALVKEGLATVSIFPPNLRYVNQLVDAGNQAEHAHIGIWALPDYAPMAINTLTEAGHSGWARWVGKVIEIRTTPKYIFLVFSDNFDARIERQWLSLFPNVETYLGKTVEVRGWLNKRKKHFSVLVRHPSVIK